VLDNRSGTVLAELPGLLGQDAMDVLRDLANPLFAGGLLAAAGCFALLVWRRHRG